MEAEVETVEWNVQSVHEKKKTMDKNPGQHWYMRDEHRRKRLAEATREAGVLGTV